MRHLRRAYEQHKRSHQPIHKNIRKSGKTVGITRNSVVTLFSKSTKPEFIKYITEDLTELIDWSN